MKEPIKIYLGDLTYDTVALSTEVFPLNIGYIAAYCKSRFGSDVDITLFKYIDELEKAIRNEPPTILGLSNYAWNQRVDIEMFRILASLNPNSLKVLGGPNLPLDLESQKQFLDKYQEVDIYVPVEGEVGFSNVVERVLEASSEQEIKKKILSKPIEGCISRDENGRLQYSNSVIRIKDLDEIPSPYTSGFLDKFFDGKLSPMIQTNRGCPFSCTFCVDGTDLVKKVNQFSIQRVEEEINYIAKHVPKNIHSLFISDLNFGMYPRDLEICDRISEIQNKYDYPLYVKSTTGKNNKERIINAIKRLNGTMNLTMSVQSLDQQVLTNIRRQNISVDHMLALVPVIEEAGLVTESEVILGLPGETYESHIKTLRDLVRAKVADISVYTCMLLPGSELNTPEQRKKWNLQTKFRVLPRDFAKLSNGKKVVEIEEVVVGSNTLTFEEYLTLRVLAFAIFVTSRGIIYQSILKLLRENNVDVFELLLRTVKEIDNAPQNVRKVFASFRKAAINELWNSPEEMEKKFQSEDEYKKLLNGEIGINVIHYHNALVTAEYMDEWTQYILDIAFSLLKETKNYGYSLELQFNDVANYCRGISHNTLKGNRMSTNPEFTFNYDIPRWLKNTADSKLNNFKYFSPKRIAFKLTDKQFKLVQDNLAVYGDSPVGRSQTLKVVPREMLWRRPIIVN